MPEVETDEGYFSGENVSVRSTSSMHGTPAKVRSVEEAEGTFATQRRAEGLLARQAGAGRGGSDRPSSQSLSSSSKPATQHVTASSADSPPMVMVRMPLEPPVRRAVLPASVAGHELAQALALNQIRSPTATSSRIGNRVSTRSAPRATVSTAAALAIAARTAIAQAVAAAASPPPPLRTSSPPPTPMPILMPTLLTPTPLPPVPLLAPAVAVETPAPVPVSPVRAEAPAAAAAAPAAAPVPPAPVPPAPVPALALERQSELPSTKLTSAPAPVSAAVQQQMTQIQQQIEQMMEAQTHQMHLATKAAAERAAARVFTDLMVSPASSLLPPSTPSDTNLQFVFLLHGCRCCCRHRDIHARPCAGQHNPTAGILQKVGGLKVFQPQHVLSCVSAAACALSSAVLSLAFLATLGALSEFN